MADQFEEAQHELDRLQDIITRYEEQMFTLRGWMLTVIGGLLAAYYTGNIHLDSVIVRIALFVVAFLFLILDARHTNVVEAVIERVESVEGQIRSARDGGAGASGPWYDGPRINEACRKGSKRVLPRREGMTFKQNQTFYAAVLLVVAVVAVALPPKSFP